MIDCEGHPPINNSMPVYLAFLDGYNNNISVYIIISGSFPNFISKINGSGVTAARGALFGRC